MEKADHDTGIDERAMDMARTLEDEAAAGPISDQEAETLYDLGLKFSRQGQHASALGFFALACHLRPVSLKYLRALALTHKALGQHAEAIRMFRVLDAMDPVKPHYTIEIAECHLRAGDAQECRRLLDDVVAHCERHGSQAEALERARALVQILDESEAQHAAA